MAEIKIPYKDKEYIMLLDDEDLPLFEHMSLRISIAGYALTSICGNQLKILNEKFGLNIEPKYRKGTNNVHVAARAHRIIMGITDPKIQVDHINGNKLDNRKENLRLATNQQNNYNVGPQKNNKSGYKGVSWKKDKNKWEAKIRNNNKLKFLGYFDDLVEAGRAYDRAALELFGEFAWTNFPREDYND